MARVLLAVQLEVVRVRLEQCAQKAGFQRTSAFKTGVISFSSFLKKDKDYQAIIIDYDQFSEEFTKMMETVRQLYGKDKPKIFVLTSQAYFELMKTLYGKGADEILVQPIVDQVIIEKLLSLHQVAGTSAKNVLRDVFIEKDKNLKWCADFKIGVEEIDNEHQEIIERFSTLYQLMRKGDGFDYYNELLDFLTTYVENHFTHEEQLQKKVDYPQIGEHMLMHEQFREQVRDLLLQEKKEKVTPKQLISVNLFIKEWLVHHILVEDKKLGEYLKKLGVQ